jgi:hypothetical protein
LVPPAIRRGRRRRRPSGAPPPLPRSIGVTGRIWLVASAALIVWLIFLETSEAARRVTDQVDAAILRQFARLRTEWLTDIVSALDRVGSGWTMFVLGIGLMVAMLAFRRWRHLFTFVGSVAFVEIIGGEIIYGALARPRPYDVTIIGRWAGFSMPAAPVAVATFIVIGIAYALVVPGRPRTIAKVVGAVVVLVSAGTQLYLAKFHPSDIVVGITLSVGVILNAFRFFTPNEVYPVKYGGGKTAHLDVTGRRGEALRQAIHDQLGMTVVEIKPVGLAGSGGSTPLRITVAGEQDCPDTHLFGKLYSMTHVRADRWYKLGRTILYGRLEDETPFQSVRRLVQYEDYALRLLADLNIPVATSYGIVELTPEREYLLLTDFFDNAEEIGDADIDDTVIDEGLLLIRRLWDVGVAHRDIKPANLLVQDGHLRVIDVAFVQVRPSPWREAVDLANMMLVLAVRTDAERVYNRALQYFSPDEIAEAFAAARGIASPSQLRAVMKQDGRDLVAQFRTLAPPCRPVSLQRWGVKRVGLALGLLLAVLFFVQAAAGMFTPAHDLGVTGRPECGTDNVMILMAQAVPSATSVPCIDALPAGWELGSVSIRRDRGRFWLDSDIAGSRAVQVTLSPPEACNIGNAVGIPSDEPGVRRFEQPEQLPPELMSTRYYVFDGGCVTYRFDFDEEATASLMFDVDRALAFQPRETLVEEVDDRNGLQLCGAGARCVGDT